MAILETIGTIGSAVSGVSSILSGIKGLFGGDDKPRRAQPPDLVALRKVAEKAGFNPLTALHATGGGGWSGGGGGEMPRLASLGTIGDAMQQIADTGFNREMQQIDKETAEIQRDVLRRQLEVSTASSAVATGQRAFGYSIPQAVAPILETNRVPVMAAPADGSMRPRSRDSATYWPVYRSSGAPGRYLKHQLLDQGITEPWQQLMPGQETEIEGEIIGEGSGFLGTLMRRFSGEHRPPSAPEQFVPPQVPQAGVTRLPPIYVSPPWSPENLPGWLNKPVLGR